MAKHVGSQAVHGHPLRYALITAARNEVQYIEATIRSVTEQTCPPLVWVIVSDGSTDGTDEIIREYSALYPWLRTLRMSEHRDRTFAAKAVCFNAGYDSIRGLDFEVVGNLDADITLPNDYYEFLLGKFSRNERLGVAGTPFVEDASRPDAHSYAQGFADLNHVSGACQTFRRPCFDEVGGYVPIKGGGIDWVAVTTARMKGWETRTFLERYCIHHRKMGTASRGPLAARFRHGQEDYLVGGHPLWQVVRGIYQMGKRPRILGGAALLVGYFAAMVQRRQRTVSDELVRFRRREQMARLRRMLGMHR